MAENLSMNQKLDEAIKLMQRSGINFDLTSQNPEAILMNMLRISGNDITDPMRVVCDICCNTTTETTMGGAVLNERPETKAAQLGEFTYTCQSCFDDFVMQDPDERKPRNAGQSRALKHGIGTNPYSYFEFDKTKSFKENALKFKSETRGIENISSWKVFIEDIQESTPQHGSVTKTFNNRDFKATCGHCKKLFDESDLKRCSNCKLARYCSAQCQSLNWKVHKKDCLKVNPKKDKLQNQENCPQTTEGQSLQGTLSFISRNTREVVKFKEVKVGDDRTIMAFWIQGEENIFYDLKGITDILNIKDSKTFMNGIKGTESRIALFKDNRVVCISFSVLEKILGRSQEGAYKTVLNFIKNFQQQNK